ncbi:MAG: hypothetical protein DDT33_01596 [Firmicutes bacterium]|nr:hypothetical protein [Bacillota bacterium]
MRKKYDDILFDEYRQSLPLTADDLIAYLVDNLQQLRTERDRLENQLATIRLILNDQRLMKNSSNEDF